MAIILVTQFNSFYSALLILSAVVMSTIGVMLGLLVTDRPFGIVMTGIRSEEHTSELQSLMRISYAVFCLKKKKKSTKNINIEKINREYTNSANKGIEQ